MAPSLQDITTQNAVPTENRVPSENAELKRERESVRSKFKILIVDDNAVNLIMGAATAEALGHEAVKVDGNQSGEDMLEQIIKSDADIVLIDMQMPRVNGDKLVALLCEHSARLRRVLGVIICSATEGGERNTQMAEMVEMAGPADNVLFDPIQMQKPVRRDTFQARVNALLCQMRRIEELPDQQIEWITDQPRRRLTAEEIAACTGIPLEEGEILQRIPTLTIALAIRLLESILGQKDANSMRQGLSWLIQDANLTWESTRRSAEDEDQKRAELERIMAHTTKNAATRIMLEEDEGSENTLRASAEQWLGLLKSTQLDTASEPFSVKSTLEELRGTVTSTDDRVEINIEDSMEDIKVKGNPHHFSAAVLNLVHNAQADKIRANNINIVAYCEGDKAYLKVTDDGIEFPDKIDAIMTGPRKASGNGLRDANFLAKLMGGKLIINRNPKSIELELPIAA